MKSKSLSVKEYQTKLKNYLEKLNDNDKVRLSGGLYIILTVVTLAFFGIFAINPTLSTISNLQRQKEDDTLVSNELQTKINNLDALDLKYNQIEPDLAYIYSAIPTSAQIPQLSRQLETLARNDNLAINRLDFQSIELYPGVKSSTPLYSFDFSLSIQGSEQAINQFITDVISFDRLVNIESYTSGKAQDSSLNLFTASLVGKVYYFK